MTSWCITQALLSSKGGGGWQRGGEPTRDKVSVSITARPEFRIGQQGAQARPGQDIRPDNVHLLLHRCRRCRRCSRNCKSCSTACSKYTVSYAGMQISQQTRPITHLEEKAVRRRSLRAYPAKPALLAYLPSSTTCIMHHTLFNTCLSQQS